MFSFFCGILPPKNYFRKILFGQRYLLVYNRFYKNRSSLEKPSTEGAIKKIIFSSSMSLYSYLKTIGWEPGFDKMFSEEKPELLGAIGEKVFYKTRVAGSNRRCLRKPKLLGAIGSDYENPSCCGCPDARGAPPGVGSMPRPRPVVGVLAADPKLNFTGVGAEFFLLGHVVEK